MEHREEPDLGSGMLGVEGNLQKGFRAGPEQQVVEELLDLQHQEREVEPSCGVNRQHRIPQISEQPG
jgi:hypothetical protein